VAPILEKVLDKQMGELFANEASDDLYDSANVTKSKSMIVKTLKKQTNASHLE